MASWFALTVSLLAIYLIGRIIRLAFGDCDLSLSSKILPENAFAGKVVWITGASSGIGKALAFAFKRHGAKLILSSRRRSVLEKLRKELDMKDSCVVLPLDLGNLDELEEIAKTALKKFGKIDVMVNNGGMGSRGLAQDCDFKLVDQKIMDVDYFGHVRISKTILPSMIENKSGIFVNVSSLAGKSGFPLRTSYCGAKHALIGYFEALEMEHHHEGIDCVNVCPGPIKTSGSENQITEQGEKFGKTGKLIGNGMDAKRCAHLMVTATHYKLHEVWISPQPALIMTYLRQYVPSLHRIVMHKWGCQQILEDFKSGAMEYD